MPDNLCNVFIKTRFIFHRFVFLEEAHNSGQLSNPEYALMKQWYRWSVDKFHKQVKPDLIGNYKLHHLSFIFLM